MTVWTIVVAAGSGDRFGERKQYSRLGAARVVDWSLRAARRVSDGVVLVVPADVAAAPEPQADAVVVGGRTRADSVRAGLDAVPADASWVLVHDAARPVPVPDVWDRVMAALADGADAVVPVVPVTDTVRDVDGGVVDRGRLVVVQTPQGFPAASLRAAHVGAAEASDDASLVERAGGKVTLVDGDPANIKITNPLDLALAEVLVR